MSTIRSRQDIRLTVPSSIESTQDVDAWLASMNDSCWRMLTGFRNWSDWIPGVRSVKQTDSQPPARGTKLQLDRGHKMTICSIDRWDPPRSLQVSIDLAPGEIAYGFLIETSPENAEMRISLDLERRLIGVSRIAALFFRWRLQKHGVKILANLTARTRPAKND
jgi:hypothetical protein